MRTRTYVKFVMLILIGKMIQLTIFADAKDIIHKIMEHAINAVLDVLVAIESNVYNVLKMNIGLLMV